MYKISKILHNKYNDDIPNNIKELMELPEIGEKMAYIIMLSAWNKAEGIEV